MILQRLFGRQRAENRRIADALYEQIVAAARQPALYADWQVPDTPLGRFEMMSLHMFLLQRRLSTETGVARDLAQQLIDDFFLEVDHSLRELGIGDMGVPKRMKKLARMHYGRTEAYAATLDASDDDALAAALQRNVRPDTPDWAGAAALATYVRSVDAALRGQTTDGLLEGRVTFPQAG